MIVDVVIAVSGLTAISLALFADNVKYRRFSPVFGIMGQPLWIYESFTKESWGIFVLSVVYLFIWGIGLRKYWWTK